MKTRFLSAEKARESRKWVVVDAEGAVVGRLATKIASILRGKTKPTYSPHNDCGDFVVVVNADKVKFTGKKLVQKKYYRHTGFIGSIREERADKLLARKPEAIIRTAVQGMLPKGPLGKHQLKKLKVYRGTSHPHAAQKPTQLSAARRAE